MTNVRTFAQSCGAIYEIERALSYYPAKASRVWDTPVQYSTQLKSSAGYASGDYGIKLHPALPSVSRLEPRATFLHEVAHILQHLIYGVIDHGATFHEIMYRLGEKPQRCHNCKLKGLKAPTLNLAGLEL